MDLGRGKGLKLWPSEGNETEVGLAAKSAKHRLFMVKFDKFPPSIFPAMMTLYKDEEKVAALKAAILTFEAAFVG